MTEDLTVSLVGDVYIDRDDPTSALEHVQPILDSTDIRFANLESIYTDNPHLAPSALLPAYVGNSNRKALLDRPFDVVSLAHNHSLDAGHAALLENQRWLRDQNIATCGAGSNIDEARTPAILTAGGRTVATLAYASMLPVGYEARQNWPGIAPMRARNIYEGTPNHWVPGELPRVRTEPIPEDAEALVADIRDARQRADVVIASFHWGDWTRKFFVSDHERRTARAAIDAGADIVVGHHHHALRGIDWYQGRPIFYGVGHLVFDAPGAAARAESLGLWPGDPDDYGTISVRKGNPDSFPFHPDMRLTAIAWCRISSNAAGTTGVDAGFIPCVIDIDGNPRPYHPDSPEGRRVVTYLEQATRAAGSSVQFEITAESDFTANPVVRVLPPALTSSPERRIA